MYKRNKDIGKWKVVIRYKWMSSNNQWQYWHITSQRKQQKQKHDWIWYLTFSVCGGGGEFWPRILAKFWSKIKIK